MGGSCLFAIDAYPADGFWRLRLETGNWLSQHVPEISQKGRWTSRHVAVALQ